MASMDDIAQSLHGIEAAIKASSGVATEEPDDDAGDHLVLTITPYVSAADGATAFGYYYDDAADREDRLPFTPRALRASDDAFRRAVGAVAARYAADAAQSILATILDGRPFEFVAFQEAGDDFFFTLRPTTPLARAEREAAVAAVRGGGDTWDCGDFGDLRADSAEPPGFAEFFRARFSDPDNVLIRLTLCDPMASLEPE